MFRVSAGAIYIATKSFFYFRRNRNSDDFFPEISISISKSEFRFWFRCRNRNFDFGFDFDIGIPILISISEFRLRHRNFDYDIGISIPTSEFRFRHRNFGFDIGRNSDSDLGIPITVLYKIPIQMSKFQSIFHRTKSKILYWFFIGISILIVEIVIEIPITFDNFDQWIRQKSKLILIGIPIEINFVGNPTYCMCLHLGLIPMYTVL
jgi:hypothetical protein